MRTWFKGVVSHALSLEDNGAPTVGVLSCGTDETVDLYGYDAINLPALAMDKKPGPVCLSLLKQDKHAKNAELDQLVQVLVGETVTIDGLSTSTITAS